MEEKLTMDDFKEELEASYKAAEEAVEDTEDIDTEALTGAVDSRERSEGEAAGQTVGRIQRKELDGETYMDVELLH